MKPEYDFLPLAKWQRREPRLCRGCGCGCGLTLLRLIEKMINASGVVRARQTLARPRRSQNKPGETTDGTCHDLTKPRAGRQGRWRPEGSVREARARRCEGGEGVGTEADPESRGQTGSRQQPRQHRRGAEPLAGRIDQLASSNATSPRCAPAMPS